MLKVAIKYCGGCNPDYDRVALVNCIGKSLHGKVEFVSAEDENIDLVLAVEGCKTACADLSAFKGTKILFITKIEDAGDFVKERESLEWLEAGMSEDPARRFEVG
jgi:hypothetical protein